jgi:hypothetical protein
MNRLIRNTGITALLAGTMALTGCATAPNGLNMISYDVPKAPPRNANLVHNIHVTNVIGGQATNPLWKPKIGNADFKTALHQSLINARLFQFYKKSHYTLTADLLKQSQPSFGIDMTVSTSVHYTLENKTTKKKLFNKTIASSYTATTSDSIIGVERSRMASEGSIRVNIKQLIQDLYKLPK